MLPLGSIMPEALQDLKISYMAPALAKGIDILECLSKAQTSLSLSALCSELGRSNNEIFRMVHVLERRGYIIHDPSANGYRLTSKSFDLAKRQGPYADVIKNTDPLLQEIASKTKHTCSLGVIHSGAALIIAAAVPSEPFALNVRIGSSSEIMTSAIGNVLYAFLTEPHRRALAANFQSRSEVDAWRNFLESARDARKIGVVEKADSHIAAVTHIALPIRSGQRLLGAINVPFVQRRNSATQAEVRQVLINTVTAFNETL